MNGARQSDGHPVFVVHGRNIAIRDAMFAFLEAIGLTPITWGDAIALTERPAPVIGQIVDAAFSAAKAAVVILTGDDLARLHPDFCNKGDPDYETQMTPQARPNVLLEAGIALARLPNQTVFVQVGNVRPLTDIAGIHILHLNNSIDTRRDLEGDVIGECPGWMLIRMS